MRDVQVVTDIEADPERVWEVLTDFPSYPSWSVFVRSVSGRAEVGSRLQVVLGLEGRRATTVRPVVVDATGPGRLAWQGRLGPPGLLGGTHEFVLTAIAHGRTRLVHRESFRGAVAALVPGRPRGAVQGFGAFNAALAHRAESLSGRGTTMGAASPADPTVVGADVRGRA